MIEGVMSKDVDTWWPYVRDYIQEALEHSLGEYSLKDINEACSEASMQLWIATSNKVDAVCVTKINQYPQKRVFVMLLSGGLPFSSWIEEGEAIMNAYAKENNCDYVQLFGRKGWTRKMKDLNYDHNRVVLTKEIT